MSSSGKQRKKEKKEKKPKKDKKDKKGKKDKRERKHDKKERKHKKEEQEEDEWIVRTPPIDVAPLPVADDTTAADDFLLRTPPRASGDGDDAAALPVHKAPSQRDDAGLSWMLRPPPRAAPRPPPERPPSPPPEVPAKPKPRELNPYLAGGGTGLPAEDDTRRRRPTYAVGDGGNSWRARAERRARERASEEGTTSSTPNPTVAPEATRREPYEDRGRDRGRTSERGSSGGGGRGWRKRTDDRMDDDRRRDHDRDDLRRRPDDRDNDDEQGSDGSHVFRARKREPPPRSDESHHTRSSASDRMEEVNSAPPVASPPAAAAAPKPRVTEEEANKLQAQLLKAEMMGDDDRIREIKGKLAQLREAKNVVVLSGLDEHGRPVNLPGSANMDEARRMLAAERETDYRSGNLDFARSLARHQAYIGEDFGEVNLGEEGRSKKRRRTGPEKSEEEMRRQRAITGESQDQRMRENCTYCLDEGKRVGKHLLVSVGEKAYVCLPHRGALVPDHCFIVPLGHAGASTAIEVDVYREIVDFQRALVRMFDQQGKAAIFFETSGTGKRAKHMVIHCVPMPKRDAAVAPGYFKKTLSESGSEWGQHRKIIDTTGKGVRRSIPKEFPYFHVQFPDGTSFGHVIEDVKGFPRDLGKEVIAGILELEPEIVRGAHESYEAQRARAQAFQRNWRPFDPMRAQRREGASGDNQPAGAPPPQSS